MSITNYKDQFQKYVNDNYDYDYIKVREHAEITQDKEYLAKFVRASDYVTDRIFDLINDYTDINWDDQLTFTNIDWDDILDKNCEYGSDSSDIYNASLYQSVNLFSYEIEEAIDSYDKMTLISYIQLAQSDFYGSFYSWSINLLKDFIQSIKSSLAR